MATATQSISATNREFEAAFGRGDAAGCAAVYTEDAKIMPPDNPAVTGKQAAQAVWQGAMDLGVKGVSLQTLDLEELGPDRAIERGTGRLDIQTEGGQTVQAFGKFIIVWKREADGSWKWDWDCWNMDAPLGG